MASRFSLTMFFICFTRSPEFVELVEGDWVIVGVVAEGVAGVDVAKTPSGRLKKIREVTTKIDRCFILRFRLTE